MTIASTTLQHKSALFRLDSVYGLIPSSISSIEPDHQIGRARQGRARAAVESSA